MSNDDDQQPAWVEVVERLTELICALATLALFAFVIWMVTR